MNNIFKSNVGDIIEVPKTGVISIGTRSHSQITINLETNLGSFMREGEIKSELFQLVKISSPIVIGSPVELWVTTSENSNRVGVIKTSPVSHTRVVTLP